jgi:dephospho-CoA kinase
VKTLRVGLTGGLASGKSTVARWLEEAGFTVIDADRLVAELYRPGQPGVEAVVHLFGKDMLDAAGGIDHARLGSRVFAHPDDRLRLEAAIHPLVGQAFAERAAPASGVVVFEATLLVESGLERELDVVVTVESTPELQLARARERGLPEQSARARLAAQGDGAQRRAAADRVIENRGDLPALHRQVEDLADDLRRLAESR